MTLQFNVKQSTVSQTMHSTCICCTQRKQTDTDFLPIQSQSCLFSIGYWQIVSFSLRMVALAYVVIQIWSRKAKRSYGSECFGCWNLTCTWHKAEPQTDSVYLWCVTWCRRYPAPPWCICGRERERERSEGYFKSKEKSGENKEEKRNKSYKQTF